MAFDSSDGKGDGSVGPAQLLRSGWAVICRFSVAASLGGALVTSFAVELAHGGPASVAEAAQSGEEARAAGTLVGDALPWQLDLLELVRERRQLELVDDVTVRTLNQAELRAAFEDMLAAELDFVQVAGANALLHFLDILPRERDALEVTLGMLEQEVLGYYAPQVGELVLVDRTSAETASVDMLRQTVMHELVHALQDAAIGLEAFRLEGLSISDAANVRSAVTEGDASVDLYFAVEEAPHTPRASEAPSTELSKRVVVGWGQAIAQADPDYPAFLYRSMLFPYLIGASFVLDVRRARGVDGVDALFAEDVPLSTEQLLHPDRYATRDEPTFVTIAPVQGCARRVYADIMGEFETRNVLAALLGVGAFESSVRAAGSGWDGDLLELWSECGARGEALVWASVWDTEADAAEFAALMMSAGDRWLSSDRLAVASSAPQVSDVHADLSRGGSLAYARFGGRALAVERWRDQVVVVLTRSADGDEQRMAPYDPLLIVDATSRSLRRHSYPERLRVGTPAPER